MLINYGPCAVFLSSGSTCILTVTCNIADAIIELEAPGIMQIDNYIVVPKNTAVQCTVYKEGYAVHGQTIIVDETKTVHVVLQAGISFTINPKPRDAIVTMIIDGFEYQTNTIYVLSGSTFGYRVEKQDYMPAEDTISITEPTVLNIEILKPWDLRPVDEEIEEMLDYGYVSEPVEEVKDLEEVE